MFRVRVWSRGVRCSVAAVASRVVRNGRLKLECEPVRPGCSFRRLTHAQTPKRVRFNCSAVWPEIFEPEAVSAYCVAWLAERPVCLSEARSMRRSTTGCACAHMHAASGIQMLLGTAGKAAAKTSHGMAYVETFGLALAVAHLVGRKSHTVVIREG